MELTASYTHELEVDGQKRTVEVELSCSITAGEQLTDDAYDAIHGVLRREAQRFAEIGGANLRTMDDARKDAIRLRSVSKDRPHVIVTAGTKDPESAVVLKGSVQVAGQRKTAPKGGR